LLLDLMDQLLSLVERDGLLQSMRRVALYHVLRRGDRRERVCPVAFGHEFERICGGPGKRELDFVIVIPIHFMWHSAGE
jgi:hypothetical protein